MNFYHNLITEKSWQLLLTLRREHDFILIGGWAVFLYTQALKSKDIDLVVDYEELAKFKEKQSVLKNERLRKYEVKTQGLDIDIYVPYYSNPGLPAEELKQFIVSLRGFVTVEKEVLAIMKEKALTEREETIKGRKDLIDLVSLFQLSDFDWGKYQRIVADFKLDQFSKTAQGLIRQETSLPELDLNAHQISRLKRRILPRLEVPVTPNSP